MQSGKYGRTYHYPFSPGTTSDDRINYEYWRDLQQIKTVVHTEKLDGENNCLSRRGVFARSHAGPTTSPRTATLREFWQRVKYDLGNLEIFLENLYAVHSIRYQQLAHHFYVFAVREHDRWLGWDEVQFYAAMLDLPTTMFIIFCSNKAWLHDIRRQNKIAPTDKSGNGTAVQLAKEQAREHLRKKRHFVWNATNITRQMRPQLIELFVTYKAYVKIVYVEVPYSKLHVQNKGREAVVPHKAVDKLVAKLEVPAPWEAHEVIYAIKD